MAQYRNENESPHRWSKLSTYTLLLAGAGIALTLVACGSQRASDDDDDNDDSNNTVLFGGGPGSGGATGPAADSGSCTAACDKLESCDILAQVDVSATECQGQCEQYASSSEVSWVQSASCSEIEQAVNESGGGESGGGESGGGESGGGESGGGESGGGESGGGESGGGESSSSFTCCLNGSFFDCPDVEAFQLCASEWDPALCERDQARDDECVY